MQEFAPTQCAKISCSACIRRSEVEGRRVLKIVSYRADVIHNILRAHRYVVRAKFYGHEIWFQHFRSERCNVRARRAGAIAGE